MRTVAGRSGSGSGSISTGAEAGTAKKAGEPDELPAFVIPVWSDRSQREFSARLARRNIAPDRPDAVAALREKELEVGQAIDKRVSADQAKRIHELAEKGLQMGPVPQNLFFGFTRLVDAKIWLEPEVIQALVNRLLDRGFDAEELYRMIEDGPSDEAPVWRCPENMSELVASFIRQPRMSKRTSIPLTINEGLARELEEELEAIGHPLKFAMGGAAAFCANLAAVLNDLAPRKPHERSKDVLGISFYAPDNHALEIAALFGSSVHMLDKEGERCDPDARVDPDVKPRRNYAAGFLVEPFSLQIGDRQIDVVPKPSASGRFSIGTPVNQQTTFGDMSNAALRRIGRDHDTFFFSGLHYHTLADGGVLPDTVAFAEQIRQIRRAQPRAIVHYQYTKPKDPENEHLLFGQLNGLINSLSLNAGSEFFDLLGHLSQAGMTDPCWQESPDDDEAEHPRHLVGAADALMAATGVQRLHLHAFAADLLILDRVQKPWRQVFALFRARQLCSMKATNDTGEIKDAHRDVWLLDGTIPGENLAAVHSFADTMQERFGLTDPQRKEIVKNLYFVDERSGRTYFYVPSRGIHDYAGTTISAGDTIDAAALVLGLEARAR